MQDAVDVLVITGSMGAGKSTILSEASDLLAARDVAHAAVDLDTLTIAHLPSGAGDPMLAWRNLACVWRTYASAGVRRLLLAQAMEDRGDLDRIRAAVSGARIVVCRLTASIATMQRRVGIREPGMRRQEFLDRVATLDAILDAAAIEAFAIVNDDRSATDVASVMLSRAGWLSA
jgi:predicted ATPase